MATTTNYSWSTPDNTAYVKDGASAIRTLGSSVDTTLYTALGGAYPGLRSVKKQTVGSGVSVVTVSSAFSATYENYLVVLSGIDASTSDANIYMTFNGTAGATYSSSGWAVSFAGAGGFTYYNASSVGCFVALTGTDNQTNATIQVLSPFATRFTTAATQCIGTNFTGNLINVDKNAVSHTGFNIVIGSGTATGGTIYVYGYGAS